MTEIIKVKDLSDRQIARISGVSHATISRMKSGKDYTMSVAKKLLPFMKSCPCCGKEQS